MNILRLFETICVHCPKYLTGYMMVLLGLLSVGLLWDLQLHPTSHKNVLVDILVKLPIGVNECANVCVCERLPAMG